MTEAQYLDALSRLLKGAEILEQNNLTPEQRELYNKRYDELTKQILVHQRMEWAI